MHNEQHDLAHEFPEFRERIHTLKIENERFRELFDEYHLVDRQVHRADTDVQPLSDEHSEEFKKRRVQLKDQLYAMLKGA
jgi:hypothetical protein